MNVFISDVKDLHQVRILSDCMKQLAGDYYFDTLCGYYTTDLHLASQNVIDFDLKELLEALLVRAI